MPTQAKARVFEFSSYEFKPAARKAVFHYKTIFGGKGEPLSFSETIILPRRLVESETITPAVTKLLEGLHLILGISYYKSYCATKVRIPYKLAKKEAEFWNQVYRKGLGEFFYRNKLDPRISPQFPYNKKISGKPISLNSHNKCLAAIGGGKDSIVCAELLKQYGHRPTAFVLHTKGKTGIQDRIISALGIKKVAIRRILDPKVYQLHPYNGHIPISAIYAFIGAFAGVLYGYSEIIVSNEYSSNFGNIRYKGEEINHQWSKSFEFETLFQTYLQDFISPDIAYFSILRPFYEIRIAKQFSKLKKYFRLFSSCNRNFSRQKNHQGLWCNKCPKCVFVFILLSAFTGKKDLLGIFGKNLYHEKSLLPVFKDVLGLGAIKPFDCVGTFEEAQTALYLAQKKFKNNYIVKELLPGIKPSERLFKAQKEFSIPEPFLLIGMEKVLILGYGKEGQATKQYLKKYYPKLAIGIADEKIRKDYLGMQNDFDIAIKTPGIKKSLVAIPYTTATNLFFSHVQRLGKGITTIGVTGSKGKSTTASLIYAVLKKAGKHAVLAGNIGTPMLSKLMRPVQNHTIFVIELSSYQLDDIRFSPDIAVITSLFPEHMDYHGSAPRYFAAKKHIIDFQNKNGCFVHDPKHNMFKRWLKDYKGKSVPFANAIPLDDKEIPLLGSHNKSNIKAAIAAVKILGVEDKAIVKALKAFKGLPHRLEFVGRFKGIDFYDDAISTTPESTMEAIRSLPGTETILLGGEDRGYDFSRLEKMVKRYRIKNIVLFPESGKRIFQGAAGKTLNIKKTSQMKEAVAFVYRHTGKGSACLLSCASPSYSLWKNFEEKGGQFQHFVKKLGK